MKTLKEIDAEIAQVQKEIEEVHGTETEVYARIVGYYRAIKNWNKGKAEEYKHRKNFSLEDSAEYDIHSYDEPLDNERTTFSPESEMFMEDSCVEEKEQACANESGAPSSKSGLTYELFARKTCPNCPPVKEWIANSGLSGKTIDVDTDQGLSEAAQKGVFAAPTVIFYKADGSESARAHNVTELEEIFALATA
ncbi:MAG: hypothetical protein K6A42_00715 [Treponema sp.]|nr:hypothetical protein [Treponema sp.]